MIWGPAWLMAYLWDEMASATVPATWGTAMLVLDFMPYLFPGSVEYMFTPGAQSSTSGPLQLKAAQLLLLSMAETAMTLLYLAGVLVPDTGRPPHGSRESGKGSLRESRNDSSYTRNCV